MKKLLCFSAILMALSAVSCTVAQELDVPELDIRVSYPQEVVATIENAGETKVYTDESLDVLWQNNDRISLFNKYTYNKEYRFSGQTGTREGLFREVSGNDVASGDALNAIYAVYPYQKQTTVSNEGVITLDLPSKQTYKTGSFGRDINTMVSATDNEPLLFRNLCGYLILNLYGTDISLSSITLQGNHDEDLAGTVRVTAPVGGVPTLAFSSEGASKTITLNCDKPITLSSSADAATAFWFVVPPTVFENGFTITVTDSQGRIFEKSATLPCEIRRNTTFRMNPLEVDFEAAPNPEEVEPEVIDLGLSVKWASWNLGATAPEEYGDYYAWGETEPKSTYDWSTYKWGNGSILTKYNTDSEYGVVDNKTQLDVDDDVAHVKLGGIFRMPTKEEFDELLNNCTSEWTSLNGVYGWKFTSTKTDYTNQWIFLPAAGDWRNDSLNGTVSYGGYWSSSIDTDYSFGAWYLDFDSSLIYKNSDFRCYGCSVRPVYGPKKTITVTLDQTELTMVSGNLVTLQATILPEDFADETITWSSSYEYVVTVDQNGNVLARGDGTATITATGPFGISTECQVTVNQIPEPETLDLGLHSGIKWASWNLGATSPEEFGNYYAWGETQPKFDYDPETYQWWENGNYLKYVTSAGVGTIDELNTLETIDDPASMAFIGDWRLPTESECRELIDNCTWSWTTLNGVNGYEGIPNNGNGDSIFLPAAGYRTGSSLEGTGISGNYWTSSLYGNSYQAYAFIFMDSGLYSDANYSRMIGGTVRPVYGPRSSGSNAMGVRHYGCCIYSNHVDISIYTENQLVPTYGWGVSTLMENWASAVCLYNGDTYNLEASDGMSFEENLEWGRYTFIWAFQNSTVSQYLQSASADNPVTIILTDVQGNPYRFVFSTPQTSTGSHYPY